nr:hypothetical protein Iba_chr09eCG10470 [Ipomoea batatas]
MLAEGVGEELGQERKLLYCGLHVVGNTELEEEKNSSLLPAAHMALEMTKSWEVEEATIDAILAVDISKDAGQEECFATQPAMKIESLIGAKISGEAQGDGAFGFPYSFFVPKASAEVVEFASCCFFGAARGEQGMVDEAQKALEEAEALKKVAHPHADAAVQMKRSQDWTSTRVSESLYACLLLKSDTISKPPTRKAQAPKPSSLALHMLPSRASSIYSVHCLLSQNLTEPALTGPQKVEDKKKLPENPLAARRISSSRSGGFRLEKRSENSAILMALFSSPNHIQNLPIQLHLSSTDNRSFPKFPKFPQRQ